MRRLLPCYFLCIISFGLQGQTADPDAFGKSVVTLNMSDLKFDKIMPFDKSFTIHLKSIPSAFNIVTVSIYKNEQTSFSGKRSKIVPAGEVLKTDEAIHLDPWERPPGGTSITEGDIIQPTYLLPNAGYILKISGGIEANLTTTQEAALSKFLTAHSKIASTINDLAAKDSGEPASALFDLPPSNETGDN